jgi:AraC-like DNA-binding protein
MFYSLRNGLKDDGYLFLYFMLLLLSYELFYKTLIHSKFIYSFPALYISGRFFNLLVYPVFLFFVFSVTKTNFRLRTKHWLLIISALTFIVFNYFSSLSLSTDEKLNNLNLFYADTRPGAFNYWANWKTLLKGTIIPLVFVGMITYEFFRFKKENSSAPKKTLLNILLAVIFLFFLFNLFSNLIYKGLQTTIDWSMIEWPVDIVFLSLVIALLSCIALLVNSGISFLPPSKYASSSLDEENYDEIISQVSLAMKEKELYKQADFNLQRLSKHLNSNPSYLSQAINHHLGMRFNDYINQFRVEEAKQQLLAPQNRHLTIEAIAELCGFQSKSTFFRAFKKVTGLTPKQFVNAQKES